MPSVTGVTTLDVAVVGGGVIGAACARVLASRGLAVALYEPGPAPGAASPASAGMLAAQIEAADDGWLTLATRARDRYPALAAELLETTAADIGLRQDGIAAVAFTTERAAALQQIAQSQRGMGHRAEWLAAAEVTHRWAAAPGCVGAMLSPDDGAVDAPSLTRALLADATRCGAQRIPERVKGILHKAGRVVGIDTGRHYAPARHVVLAAGAWSPGVRGLPRALPVVPMRGQLAAMTWPARVPTAILYHDHGYVLRRGNEAILGSTMEHAGFDARVTATGQAEILAGAHRMLPALARQAVDRRWAGLRPVTPDGLPIVGADPEIDGLWYATGHGRNGILLAALTGDIIADLITTGTTAVDLSLFRPDRFSAVPEALGPKP